MKAKRALPSAYLSPEEPFFISFYKESDFGGMECESGDEPEVSKLMEKYFESVDLHNKKTTQKLLMEHHVFVTVVRGIDLQWQGMMEIESAS